MDIDGAMIHVTVPAPNKIQKLIAAPYAARTFDKRAEQTVFSRAEM